MNFNSFFSKLKAISKKTDINFYIVGGAVRDMLDGRKDAITDVDISVEYRFDEMMEILSSEFEISDLKFSRLKTASFKCGGLNVDVVTARRENYEEEGTLPKIIPARIEDDLRRRDFTINSIAYSPALDVYKDTMNGIEDLKKRILKENREGLFDEDPTRIFRLIKYRSRLDLTIDKETENDMKRSIQKRQLFENVSKSRISREWMQIVCEDKGALIIDDLVKIGLMGNIFGDNVKWNPYVIPCKNSIEYTVSTIVKDNEIADIIRIIDALNNGITKKLKKEVETISAVINNNEKCSSELLKRYPDLLKEYSYNIHS